MNDLSSEYMTLFNGITDSIKSLEILLSNLKSLQQKAEEEYINNEEDDDCCQEAKKDNTENEEILKEDLELNKV